MTTIIKTAAIAFFALTAGAAAQDIKTSNDAFVLENVYATMDAQRQDITILVMAKAEAKIEQRLAKIENVWTAPEPRFGSFLVAVAE